MSENMAPTPIIQNSIPVRYDPRVVVKPCEPDRVPYLPGDILYMIAQALPQPKQVFNLALASKATWHHLQPALYECEVTYEARLAHRYGDRSSADVVEYHKSLRTWIYADEYQDEDEDTDEWDEDQDQEEEEWLFGWDSIFQFSEDEWLRDEGDWLNGFASITQMSEDEWLGDEDDYSDSDYNSHSDYYSDSDYNSDNCSEDYHYESKRTRIAWEKKEDARASLRMAALLANEKRERMQRGNCECPQCTRRIDIDYRVFKATMPRQAEPFHIAGAMTALHWASTRGAPALPVAQRAIQAALAHQPSYINGLDLIERVYYVWENVPRFTERNFGDHPPPLFLALAHGNLELSQALIDAGADVSLTLGWTSHSDDDGSRRYVVLSKIHSRCVAPGETVPGACKFEEQNTRDPEPDYPIICQTIGHLAIQLGKTEVLQVLLRNGLDSQQTLCPLLHHAVLLGNLPAMRAILAHDTGAVHGYYKDKTVLHLLPWMKIMTEAEVHEEKLKSMASCLVEHGISVEAPARRYNRIRFFPQFGDDTALDSALECLETFDGRHSRERAATALRAVNVLISLGASWLPGDAANGYLGGARRRFLSTCIEETVLIMDDLWQFHNTPLSSLDLDTLGRRPRRKIWGQTCKSLIQQASEALTRDRDAGGHGTEAIQEILDTGFRGMVDLVDLRWHRMGIVGWWALEALGNLFLSTGIEPCEKTMHAWDRILKRDYQGPVEFSESIDKFEEVDGDKSEWAFILEGITFKNTEGTYPPCEHNHFAGWAD